VNQTLHASRAARLASFDPADFPMPTGHEEEWRFTPISQLAPLLSGPFGGQVAGQVLGTGSQWDCFTEGESPSKTSRGPAPADRAAAIAWVAAEQAEVWTVRGRAGGETAQFKVQAAAGLGAHHWVVCLEAGARAGIVLDVFGQGDLTQTVEIEVGPGAHLDLVTVQELGPTSVHHAAHRATVGQDGQLRHTLVSVGAAVSRTTVQAELAGPGGNIELFGLNLTGAGQHHEAQLFVDHVASNCRSRATYFGALLENGARSVWIGDVLIRSQAHGTNSYEENRNLVLAKGATADAVPNLEIETGQIEGAGHAAATGRFDEQQLFYLMSRGIDANTARSMVVHAFFAQLINQIGTGPLQARLTRLAESKLLALAGPEGDQS